MKDSAVEEMALGSILLTVLVQALTCSFCSLSCGLYTSLNVVDYDDLI